jgi:hypothetical protein
MQLLAGLADPVDQPGLDVHVDVFECNRPGKISLFNIQAYGIETVDNLRGFRFRYDADMGQHAGMGDRTSDVLAIEAVIEADRSRECLDESVGRLGKPAAPGFFRGVVLRHDPDQRTCIGEV